MRKVILFWSLLFSGILSAQSGGREAGNTPSPVFNPSSVSQSTLDFLDEVNRRSIDPKIRSEYYTGSPYLTENFKEGKLISEGKEVEGLFRYNVLSNEMEFRANEDAEIIALPTGGYTIYTSNGLEYIWENLFTEDGWKKGYFIKYFTTNDLKFYGLPVISIRPAKKPASGYDDAKPVHYKVEIIFYLSNNNSRFNSVRIKNRDFQKLFDSDDRAEDYLNEHKLKEVFDVIKFLEFYVAG